MREGQHMIITYLALSAAALVRSATVPKPCCFPTQWEGVVFQQDGGYLENQDHATYQNKMVRISTDYGEQKRVMNTQVLRDKVSGQKSSVKETYIVIEDFQQRTMWVIRHAKCTKQHLGSSLEKCIADGADFLGRHLYGGVAVNTWVSRANNVTSRMTVSEDGCYPLASTSVTTTARRWTLQLSHFQNVSEGIKDPSVFHVPDICDRNSFGDL